MTSDLHLFNDLDDFLTSQITMCGGTISEAQGKGIVILNSFGLKRIQNVLHAPRLNSNLLSIGKFMLDGYSLLYEESTCFVYKYKLQEHLLFEVPMLKKKIFPHTLTSVDQHSLKASVGDKTLLCHYRYGHLNFKSLALMYE